MSNTSSSIKTFATRYPFFFALLCFVVYLGLLLIFGYLVLEVKSVQYL